MSTRRSLCRALLVLLAVAGSSMTALAGPPAGEHPLPGPSSPRGARTTDEMPAANHVAQPRAAGTRSATPTPAPFLTRPYWHAHTVTSIFDHCNPDYSQDGKVCEFDGTVALKTSGADASFNRGYAITPKGSDYLYYDGHNGWDYALSYEPVVAAAAGTVQTAGADGGFGLSVTIDHGNGYGTRYAHLSQITVSPGEQVGRGQGLGTSGNTGNSSGPHLHFGVYLLPSWTAIDPWGWTGDGTDPWPSDTGNLWIGGAPHDAGPSTPTGVSATVSGNSVTVKWAPGGPDGGTATSYTVSSSPASESVVVSGKATSATLSCLPNPNSFTFTVTPVNGGGTGAPSAPSNRVTTSTPSAQPSGPGVTGGYTILNSAGAIYTFCRGAYFGNLLDHGYPGPAVGVATTPAGAGYNILTHAGLLYSFGNAQYYGNLLDHGYPGPASALAFTPSGGGYAILTSAGLLYTFGDALYWGNLLDHHYPGTAVGLAYTPSGRGYYILTREGAIYSFGDAGYFGNLLDHGYPGEAKSISNTRDGRGYAIMTTDGTLYPFGDQPYFGSLLDHGYPGPAEAVSNTP